MKLDKYDLPNFFIRKNYKNGPGTFNHSGCIFYITPIDSESVEAMWDINIDFPGGNKYIHHATTTGSSLMTKKYVEDNFYHVNRLDYWKKKASIRAIFHEQNEDVIK